MTQPAAADGYEPVRVHITGMEAGVSLGQVPRPRKRIVTRFAQESVDATNLFRPILPDEPGRVMAYAEVSGGDVILCGSEQDAKRATPTGSVLPTAFTAPWPIRGTNAVWAVQKTSSATPCVISVTADYEVEG